MRGGKKDLTKENCGPMNRMVSQEQFHGELTYVKGFLFTIFFDL